MSPHLAGVLWGLAAAAGNTCGSTEVAHANLQDQVVRFKAGMTFQEVRTQIAPPDALPEYWGSPPRKEMGPWILSGRDGNRLAVVALVCDFDEKDLLVACRPWDDERQIQDISDRAYDQIKEGDSLSAVVARLCEPGSRSKADDGSVVLEYSVQHPGAKYHKTCPAYLTFRNEHLTRKNQPCR